MDNEDFHDFGDFGHGADEDPAAAGAGYDDDDEYAFSADALSAEVQYADGSPYDPFADDDMLAVYRPMFSLPL